MIVTKGSLKDCIVLRMLSILEVRWLYNKDSFHYVGIAILCCEGIFTILPIRDSMVNKLDFKMVAIYSMMTAFGISIFIALITVPIY